MTDSEDATVGSTGSAFNLNPDEPAAAPISQCGNGRNGFELPLEN